MTEPDFAVVGGGPAGLMAAETASAQRLRVAVFDRMPSLARKFLMAGRGGLNLTHSEPLELFLSRYGEARSRLEPAVRALPPAAIRAWAEGLGQPTFEGAGGRVFPTALKASPLLRAWLRRLERQGVSFHGQHAWRGWTDDGALSFRGPGSEDVLVRPRATLLALGGASWPRLGSDGGWSPVLAERGVALAPFRPANGGFEVAWSEPFHTRFAGAPLKAVALSFGGRASRGEVVVTARGLEGGGVYALGPALREAIAAEGSARLVIDLKPDLAEAEIARRLASVPSGASLSTRLRKALHLSPVAANLLRESGAPPAAPEALAARVKALVLTLTAPFPLARAISTAGGVMWSEVADDFALRRLPGVWAAGEMLDWEAPTGGHLLTACFATGAAAGRGVVETLIP